MGERLLRELQREAADEPLDGKAFCTLKEAGVVIEQWRRHDNSIRPHASLGDHPPAPQVVIRPTERSRSAPSLTPPTSCDKRCKNFYLRPQDGGEVIQMTFCTNEL